jgi:hypothetical protein
MRRSSPVVKLFATGRIVDLIVALMLVEFGVSIAVRARTRRGIHPIELAVSLAAGMALLLALRSALVGSSWQHTAVWLVVALMAHMLYLTLRWGTP